MLFPITSIFAVVFVLIYLLLGVHTHQLRKQAKVPLGEGKDDKLLRASRAHGNFNEYVPLGLILMMLLETTPGGESDAFNVGLLLIVGRVAHAISVIGYEVRSGSYILRIAGMALTWLSLAVAAFSLFMAWYRF